MEEAGIRDHLHADLLAALKRAGKLDLGTVNVDGVTVRAFGGGEATGHIPVDRRKPGSTHSVMVDKAGVPLLLRTAGANASDHRQTLPVILDFPRVGGTPGRPKELPDDVHADRENDREPLRCLLRWLGIEPPIAKRRTPHVSGLGKVRWVVERTIAWMMGLRRMRVRYDRLGVIMDTWATLAARVICFLHHNVL